MVDKFWLKVLFCSVVIFSACSTCESTTVNVGRRNTTVMLQYPNGQNARLTTSDGNGNVVFPCGEEVAGTL